MNDELADFILACIIVPLVLLAIPFIIHAIEVYGGH